MVLLVVRALWCLILHVVEFLTVGHCSRFRLVNLLGSDLQLGWALWEVQVLECCLLSLKTTDLILILSKVSFGASITSSVIFNRYFRFAKVGRSSSDLCTKLFLL